MTNTTQDLSDVRNRLVAQNGSLHAILRDMENRQAAASSSSANKEEEVLESKLIFES